MPVHSVSRFLFLKWCFMAKYLQRHDDDNCNDKSVKPAFWNVWSIVQEWREQAATYRSHWQSHHAINSILSLIYPTCNAMKTNYCVRLSIRSYLVVNFQTNILIIVTYYKKIHLTARVSMFLLSKSGNNVRESQTKSNKSVK